MPARVGPNFRVRRERLKNDATNWSEALHEPGANFLLQSLVFLPGKKSVDD
jgi:hypothetical protein